MVRRVLNLCNRNISLHGSEVYNKYRSDLRVIVDEPPRCTTNCYNCSQGPIAVYIPDRLEDLSLDTKLPHELLRADTTKNLIRIIEDKINKK